VGRITHYVRSNTDGSEAEYISIYRQGDSSLAVYKMRERCTNAALVTAVLDPATRHVTRLAGGRLGRDGTQQAFAWLRLDSARTTLTVSMEGPDGTPAETAALPGQAPWRLYDFDFADWNAFAARPESGQDIRFDAVLIWPEPSNDNKVLHVLGTATARFEAREERRTMPAFRYRLEGGGFEGPAGGELWIDQRDGTIIEATLGRPSHPGYADFHLVRTGQAEGDSTWRALLAAHWSGCDPR
jgi:hypothetical protein